MSRAKDRQTPQTPNQRKSHAAPISIGPYGSQLQLAGAENRQKVTISVNAFLLRSVDDYVDRTGTNRSAVFEQALLMWCQWLQEQVDIAYYSNLSEADRAAVESWTRVTTEAAKHIWSK